MPKRVQIVTERRYRGGKSMVLEGQLRMKITSVFTMLLANLWFVVESGMYLCHLR